MLLDLQMPIKNGIQVVEECKQFFARLQSSEKSLWDIHEPEYVFLTSFKSNSLEKYLKDKKITKCFEKPITASLMK
jgi:CheY-like chemotaxis protein